MGGVAQRPVGEEEAVDPILEEQTRYYVTRGVNRDDWFYRRGRYDHGPIRNRAWFREAVNVTQALTAFEPKGNVLEIAGGSGLWTRHLVMTADRVTVVDVSAKGLEVNRSRLGAFVSRVRYVEADIFAWRSGERFDSIFSAFFFSHVPPQQFDRFWKFLGSLLLPGGRVFWIDTKRSQTALGLDYRLPPGDSITTTRRADGREYRIYKRYQTPESLARQLSDIGWEAEVASTEEFFLYGSARPR